MDDVMAQFGFGTSDADSEQRMRGLAKQLRGNRDMGQFFQLSGNEDVRESGRSMLKSTDAAIDQIGTRRGQGLTRAAQAARDAEAKRRAGYLENRDTEQDVIKDTALKLTAEKYGTSESRKDAEIKLADDKLKYEREGWTDVESYKDTEGNITLRGRKDGRGPLMEVPDSAGYTPYDKYASRSEAKRLAGAPKRLAIEGTNLEYLRYPDGMVVYGTKEYPSMQAFAADRPDIMSAGNAAQADEKYAIENAGEMAKGRAKEVTELRTGLAKTNSGYSGSEDNMRGIINAIDQGANPGQIYAMMPTITNASSLLESIVDAESLELLNTYQLKPVSDKDMAVLKSVASPTMDGPALKAWAENKIIVLQRAQASGRVFEEWVSTHNEVPRGEARDQLQKDMDAAADAAGGDPGLVQLPGGDGGSVGTQTDIIVLDDGSRWNADGTPAE